MIGWAFSGIGSGNPLQGCCQGWIRIALEQLASEFDRFVGMHTVSFPDVS